MKWYRKAAEQGYAKAQYNLGNMYREGEGVKQDYAKAVRWYTKAAEQGYALAQCNLGVMYANGTGVSPDYKLAYGWFSLSAAQGDDVSTEYRDKIAKKLTPQKLEEAQALAAKMHQENESRKE